MQQCVALFLLSKRIVFLIIYLMKPCGFRLYRLIGFFRVSSVKSFLLPWNISDVRCLSVLLQQLLTLSLYENMKSFKHRISSFNTCIRYRCPLSWRATGKCWACILNTRAFDLWRRAFFRVSKYSLPTRLLLWVIYTLAVSSWLWYNIFMPLSVVYWCFSICQYPFIPNDSVALVSTPGVKKKKDVINIKNPS